MDSKLLRPKEHLSLFSIVFQVLVFYCLFHPLNFDMLGSISFDPLVTICWPRDFYWVYQVHWICYRQVRVTVSNSCWSYFQALFDFQFISSRILFLMLIVQFTLIATFCHLLPLPEEHYSALFISISHSFKFVFVNSRELQSFYSLIN